MKERIEKLRDISKGIISSFFIAEQYWQMLEPLLHDEDVYSRWNHDEGVMGVKVLRLALYTNIILDMCAIMFDADRSSGSLKRIIDSLKDDHIKSRLKSDFCNSDNPIVNISYPEEKDWIAKESQRWENEELEKEFQRLFEKIIEGYENLKSSCLSQKIKKARDKIFAHKEIRTVGDERRLYNAKDIGIVFDDAKKFLDVSMELIFDTHFLLTRHFYSTDAFLERHKEVAIKFWKGK